MSDGPSILSLEYADPGATQESLKATEMVVQILSGFTNRLALSILLNASAIVLCHACATETEAIDRGKRHWREIERAIRKNHKHFKQQERQR